MPLVSTPIFLNFSSKSFPSRPVPITPTAKTFAPRATRLFTTLPEPPGVYSSSSTETTRTGASGDMRSTDPHKYSSIIKSPTTRILHLSNFEMSISIVNNDRFALGALRLRIA